MAELLAASLIRSGLMLAAVEEVWVVALVVAAALLGFGVVKLLDYLRKHDADKQAAQIIELSLIHI